MSKDEGSDESIELALTDYVKLRVPSVITRSLFGSSAATAETLQRLGRSATAKIATGVQLHPDEQIAHDLLMEPLRKKAARLLAIGVRAAQILANEPKLLPGHVEGQPAPEPQQPSEAWSERHAGGASLDASPDVREMWARILAGEAAKPGSFSFKTLSVLKDVDTEGAQAFVALLAFGLSGIGVPHRSDFSTPFLDRGLRHSRFLALEELGLLNFAAGSAIHPGKVTCQGLVFRTQAQEDAMIDIHTLTQAGRELASISDQDADLDAARAVGNWLSRRYPLTTVAIVGASEARPWNPDELVLDPLSSKLRFT